MVYEIHWTDNALNDLENLLEFIQNNWSDKELDSFKSVLRDYLGVLSVFPLAFPKSTELEVELRRVVITSQTSIIYRIVNPKSIHIIRLLDNRSLI